MRRESPVKRRNPSSEIVWVARYTGSDGKHRIAKPRWNRGKGTFKLKREAQQAIDEAYGLSDRPDTLGEYFATWPTHHPRSDRTNETNEHRISRVLEVEVEGIPLKHGRCASCAAATLLPWSITCCESKAEPQLESSASSAPFQPWPRTRSPMKSPI